MSQIILDYAEINSGFQQVRCPRMAQGMHGGRFLHSTLLQSLVKSSLHSCHMEGGHSCSRISLLAVGRWKEPNWIAMRPPILAQHFQDGFGERNIAVFPALSLANMDYFALRIDVLDL